MFGTEQVFTSLSFNQDGSCFIAGRVDGFSIYNVDPCKEIFRRVFTEQFGVKVCAMHYRTSLVAFTGDSTENLRRYVQNQAQLHLQNSRLELPQDKYQHLHSPIGGFSTEDQFEKKFYPNVVYLYDDAQNQFLGRLRFNSEVYSIKFRKDCVVVSLLHQIYVHSLKDLSLIDVINTADYAPSCSVSTTEDDFVIAYVTPGTPGRVGLNFYQPAKQKIERRYIDCHKSNITALVMSENGQIVATGSEQGQYIRCFLTVPQSLLCSFERGADRQIITSLTLQNQLLGCFTNKGTFWAFQLPKFEAIPLARVSEMLEGEPPKFQKQKCIYKKEVSPLQLQMCGCFIDDGVFIATAKNQWFKMCTDNKRNQDGSLEQ